MNRKRTQPTLLTSLRIHGYIIIRGYIENHTRKTLVMEEMRYRHYNVGRNECEKSCQNFYVCGAYAYRYRESLRN